MYVVDLHQKNENTEASIYNLFEAIKLARRTKEKIVCAIVGYGSTGGSHKIKNAVMNELLNLKAKKQIKEFIIGNEIDMFNDNYQKLKHKNLIPLECKKRKNPGEVIIIL